ncbi:MAG: hypothetical protein C3F17_13160 [Bradyrhizobiaceae bacterium]|nr:MAG: hypothetical protein C3F17_13160 [Bradyrhizobiaceae bacterium]
MFKLFQSIFAGASGNEAGHPAELVNRAVDRALDATDPRIRAVSGFRKKLEPAVVRAIDHVKALALGMPAPVEASHATYGDDARLAAFFASPDRMSEVFGADRALIEYLANPAGTGTEPILALLLVERTEKKVLGMAVQGDHVQRDVAQVQVSFDRHRLVDPSENEDGLRRAIGRRAYDQLLAMALARIAEVGGERESLEASQSVLRAKLRALKSARWDFTEGGEEPPDPDALEAKLAEIEGQLAATGTGSMAIPRHLEILVETLSKPGDALRVEPLTILMDRMGIRQASPGATTVELQLRELRNAAGATAVALPIAIPRGEIPKRDLLAEVERALI